MKVCTTCGAEYGDEKLFCERDGTPLRKSGALNDLVGMVIADRYHITKKLGEGGMGQVYLAEHVKMGRRCAIKIMTPGTMTDPEAISRFNREAANASRISHPNVCAIYDFGETPDGLIYLAMEYIEGQSLTDVLAEAGTLPLARAATMIFQCAEGLQVAHDLGIVHRDLKPDNIMVTTTRGKDTVKVVDFGIAKAMSGDESRGQKVTKTGFVVGTPEYMSPEQLAGDPVDGRSDLYSLGLVFYRMLTGASPFPADSQQETMIKRLTDDPMPLATARPDFHFPPEVQRVLNRALARNPNERHKNAADLAREVHGLSTHATGKVDVEAGTQVVRADELKAAMPATRVDPLAAREKPKAPPSRTQTGRAVPAKQGLPMVPVAVGVLLLAVGGGAYAMRDRLFGSAAVPPDTTHAQAQRPESTHVQTMSGGDTTKPVDTGKVRPAGNNPGGIVKPPVSGTRRDSVPPPQPPRPIPTTAAVVLPDVDDVFDAGTRDGARQKAEAIFQRRDVSDSIKAAAANMVAVAYQEDKKYADALVWAQRSQALRATESGQSLVNTLKKLVSP